MARLTELDHLLFPVEERFVFASVADASGKERLVRVTEKKAIVNRSNSHVLGIVGRDYRLVTNREALDMAFKCASAVFPDTKASEWVVETVDAPSTAWCCFFDVVHNSAALDFTFVPATKRPDAFGPFIRVTNSYNSLRALAFSIGFYRKKCTNGLILPESIIQFKFPHSRRDIAEIIEFNVDHVRLTKIKSAFNEYMASLRDCKVPHTDFQMLVSGVLLIKQPEAFKDNREAAEWKTLIEHLNNMCGRYASELGENAYAAFNVITEFATNPLANRYVRRDRHSLQRLAGTWTATFSRECKRPGFQFAEYLKDLSRPKAKNTDLSRLEFGTHTFTSRANA